MKRAALLTISVPLVAALVGGCSEHDFSYDNGSEWYDQAYDDGYYSYWPTFYRPARVPHYWSEHGGYCRRSYHLRFRYYRSYPCRGYYGYRRGYGRYGYCD